MLALVIRKKYQKVPKYFQYADLLEIRVDLINNFDLGWIANFLKKVKKPWILTVRSKEHGGSFRGSEKQRFLLINKCLQLKPNYLDLEYDVSLRFAKSLKNKYPDLKLIRSFHDFDNTPENITDFIELHYHQFFDIHKFAFQARSAQDTLKMMHYLCQSKKAIALISMGRHGHPLRAIGKILNNAINYAATGKLDQIASQLTIKEMIETYNYLKQDQKTKIYALIGKSIKHSIGHLFHNFFFMKNNINAVYVKIPLKDSELDSFFKYAKNLPIKGLSVTTPFKNKLSSIIDSDGPINTLKKVDFRWLSKNTDGIAAFKIMDIKKESPKILLLGAGPAALAIFEEFKKRGFSVDIYNRSYLKAALLYKGQAKVIEKFNYIDFSEYGVVINAASYKANFDLNLISQKLKKPLTYLNINYQKIEVNESRLIKYLSGKYLFFHQAVYQQMFWNNRKFSFKIIEEFQKKLEEGSTSMLNLMSL